MPLIKSLPPLTIGFRRAEMRAFWFMTTAVCGLALVCVAGIFGARTPWAWGALALVVPLPGLIWRPWFEMGVRAWNKGVRLSTIVLRAYVLKSVYYLVFAAVGRTGSSLQLVLRDATVSRWIPRTEHDLAFGECDRLPDADGWWGRELLASARRPGNAWQVCLLPVVLLLILLRDEGQESALPSSTYTLY